MGDDSACCVGSRPWPQASIAFFDDLDGAVAALFGLLEQDYTRTCKRRSSKLRVRLGSVGLTWPMETGSTTGCAQLGHVLNSYGEGPVAPTTAAHLSELAVPNMNLDRHIGTVRRPQ